MKRQGKKNRGESHKASGSSQVRKGPGQEEAGVCVCVCVWHKREKEPYNLRTSLKALRLVNSMEGLSLLNQVQLLLGFLISRT